VCRLCSSELDCLWTAYSLQNCIVYPILK
jgi:hypothetical protein